MSKTQKRYKRAKKLAELFYMGNIELGEMTVNQKPGRTYNVTNKSYDESGEFGFMNDKLYYESEMTIIIKVTQEIG